MPALFMWKQEGDPAICLLCPISCRQCTHLVAYAAHRCYAHCNAYQDEAVVDYVLLISSAGYGGHE